MSHKYLENLERWESFCEDDAERMPKWLKEQETYGFDHRETWNLSYAFYAWLYERLRMYVEVASKIVDLEYHKFTFKGYKFNQLELINMMLERIEFYFTEEYNDWDADDCAYVEEIGQIWAIVLPAMWWW